MKRTVCIVFIALIVSALALPAAGYDDVTEAIDYTAYAGTKINVYNWGEYISDGSEDSADINAMFTALTGIVVNYSTFESNETLYAKLQSGAASYDVIIPSDYMVARLASEGMLMELDFSNIPNYANISDKYKNLYFDPFNKYSVPYTAGMLGLIYNTKVVTETPDSWGVMWDQAYAKKILMINNCRDGFSIAQFLLGYSVNGTDETEWRSALDKLKEQKPLVQSYVMDEVFNKMEKGEAAIAAYYAGDFLTMYQNNEDLAFVYPKEGTNIFVDAMCIPKGARNKAAAELYINFLLDTEVAVANAEYICYASPNTKVVENEEYRAYMTELHENALEYLYPDNTGYKVEYFENLPKDTITLMNSLWEELKTDGGFGAGVYIACIAVVVVVGGLITYSVVKKKIREKA